MENLRSLGKSDIRISPIGLGTWQFAEAARWDRFFWRKLSEDVMNGIVSTSLDNSINWFDTAEAYGGGRSERALRRSLRNVQKENQDVIIATKWLPVFRTARSIEKTIGKRITNLAPYDIDLYQIHQPFSFSSVEAQMKAMAKLVHKGLIKSIGVSNFSEKRMRKAYDALENNGLPLVSNQVLYNLLERKIEKNGIMESAKELGVTIIAYSPLAQGLLSETYLHDPSKAKKLPFIRKRKINRKLKKVTPLLEELASIANKYSVTISQVVLSWITTFHGEIVVTISGASTITQAKDNATAMKLVLSKTEIENIDELSKELN
ncbi:MAG: aldo/keto reductase [Candidatus Hodarchaeales archaeon]|jgi:aryl-alcohol dehydrogenase-like predicted oxidoreductase